ncbi:MAG: nucleotidyltransferase domain-containing protein [Gaiellaceae bacterium]
MEAELRELLAEAQADSNAVALVLFGSAAAGSAHEESDLDVWYVVHSDPPERSRRGRLELIPTTAEQLRNAPDWLKPALAYAQVLWDSSGEIAPILTAARSVSREETAELYDGYLNDVYRSLKTWRRGLELPARVECGRSLRFLGELLFALEGRRAPYPNEWTGRLGELEPLFLEVARTADPRAQQRLCTAVARLAAERGYGDVYDAWHGDIDGVLAFEFPEEPVRKGQ